MPDEGRINHDLTTALRKEMPGAVVFKLSDRATSGIPDISLDWFDMHVWIETKRAAPKFKSQGIQEMTMMRLLKQGEAWYVIYDEDPRGIYICSPVITRDPDWVKNRTWRTNFIHHVDGWDHNAVARYFKHIIEENEEKPWPR